jgi:hypothetical protein
MLKALTRTIPVVVAETPRSVARRENLIAREDVWRASDAAAPRASTDALNEVNSCTTIGEATRNQALPPRGRAR